MNKKFIALALVVCLSIVSVIIPAYAAETTVSFTTLEDYNALGVKTVKPGVYPDDYVSADGKVNNFRCNVKAIDGTEHYWLIQEWTAHKVSSLYLGDAGFDMSKVTKITIDYLSNSGSGKTNVISLSKDAEGTQVVATVNITEFPAKNMTEVYTAELAVTDPTYNGPVYLYVNSQVRIFVGNLQITSDDSIGNTGDDSGNTGDDSGSTNPNPDTGDFGLISLAFVALSSIVIKKKKEI